MSRYEAPQRPAGPQLGWVVAAILAIALVGVGSATAGSLLTGKQVRNGSLTGLDIRDRSIKAKDIALGSITPKHLRKGTSAVTIGQPGPAGPAGATGAAGASGPQGEAGLDGSLVGTAGGVLTGTYPNPALAAGSVTAAALGAGSVTSAALAPGTALANISPGSILGSALAPGTITGSAIEDGGLGVSDLGLSGSVTIDPPLLAIGACSDVDVTVTGAETTDYVIVMGPSALENGLIGTPLAPAADDQIRIRICSTAAITNGTGRSWRYIVLR